jgi:outer membrane protein TolC
MKSQLCFRALQKRYFGALTVLLLIAAEGFPQQLPAGNLMKFNQTLSSLIRDALAQNRSVKAAGSRVDQAAANEVSRSSLDPPTFEFEAMDARVSSFPNPFADQMETDYSLSQMIPFPGKLGAMKKAELKNKEMLQFDKTSLEQELVYKIKQNFFDIYLIDRQIAINANSQQLLKRIIEIARSQYEVGMGKQADILRAQTELSVLKRKMAIFEQRRRSMTAMINAIRSKPSATSIDTIPEIEPVLIADTALPPAGKQNRPEVKSMQAAVRMKEAELSAVQKEWLPDFMVKGTYQNRRPTAVSNDPMAAESGAASVDNGDHWSVMLGFTIPVAPWSYKKNAAAVALKKSAIAEGQANLEEMQNMISSQIEEAYAEVQSTARQISISRTSLLPQAEMAFQSALASYQTGGQEFTMLLDTQRMLLMAREDFQMTVMSYLSAVAKLERALGTDPNTTYSGVAQ